MSVAYLSLDSSRAVVYRSPNGSWDIVSVVPGTREQDWPVLANRDWFKHAIAVAERKELP